MAEAAREEDWWSAIAAYLTPRMLIILAMGFASGLPLLLTLSTLSYWLSKLGVDKTTIGLFALVGTPYTFKFLWSPIIDQVPLPVLTRLLGRRRSWLLLTQVLLAVAIFAMGQVDPTSRSVRDRAHRPHRRVPLREPGHRHRCLPHRVPAEDEQGQGRPPPRSAIASACCSRAPAPSGCRISFPGRWCSPCCAAAMAASAVLTLLVPEPKVAGGAGKRDYAQWVKESVIDPFADFMSRRGWVVILLFVLFYKFGDALGGTMANPFYVEMGYTGLEDRQRQQGVGHLDDDRRRSHRRHRGGPLGRVPRPSDRRHPAGRHQFRLRLCRDRGRHMACAPRAWLPIRSRRQHSMPVRHLPALASPSRPTTSRAALPARHWSPICPACAMSPSPPRNMPC